ncbi:MAG: bifunctional DNA-binding transcriptional regulator/O6-methylguanine-DNA methyltransferase Ada [Pyrinomonadaceae bacterium]
MPKTVRGDNMSALMKPQPNLFPGADEAKWIAVCSKDARFDGKFVFAVSSTGIYCRPSCPSRRPNRERVSFFELPEAAEQSGYRACRRCHPRRTSVKDPQVEMARRVCELIDNNSDELMTLAALSNQTGISSFHLQRTFKKVMGVTPRQYSEARRLGTFKSQVRSGESVTNAIYDAGFGSSSRLYEHAVSRLGMTPATYGKGGRGATIRYSIVSCSLGNLLVAATGSGVCSVKLGDSEPKLQSDLEMEFPAAEIQRDDERLRRILKTVMQHLEGKTPHIDLPLDVQATAFQRQVWEQLRQIPYGETQSYSELAKAIGQQKAVRAVARACATNPVALVIPCHRIILGDKSLGGYRWGLERKKRLLEREAEAK